MKKFILRLVSPIVAPLIRDLVKDVFKQALNEFFKRDQVNCRVAVVSLYPVLDIPSRDWQQRPIPPSMTL
jgi:hypothetical protein